MSAPSILAVVLQVIDILEDLGVAYHLGGSFASTIHGIPRQTRDVDIVVDLDAHHIPKLAAALGNGFYFDTTVIADAVAQRTCFNAIHLGSGFKVDFFVKGGHQFDEVEFQRSVQEQIVSDPPRSVAVKSAEDTVLRKLQWYKDGGGVSDRQWNDILGVLKTQTDRLDTTYMEHWARRLGLLDLLTKAQHDLV